MEDIRGSTERDRAERADAKIETSGFSEKELFGHKPMMAILITPDRNELRDL